LLYLNSKLGQGATGVVHGGVLEVEDSSDRKSSRLDIAAKLSFTDMQRERLQQEWSVYMHLTMEGIQGIPTLLGLFYDPELEDRSPLCLLTCYAGLSLRRSGQSITSIQRYVHNFFISSTYYDPTSELQRRIFSDFGGHSHSWDLSWGFAI
jgi:hypothetical protein